MVNPSGKHDDPRYVLCDNRATRYTEWKLVKLKGEVKNPTIKIGDTFTSLLEIDRTTRQKTIKDTKDLKNIINTLWSKWHT